MKLYINEEEYSYSIKRVKRKYKRKTYINEYYKLLIPFTKNSELQQYRYIYVIGKTYMEMKENAIKALDKMKSSPYHYFNYTFKDITEKYIESLSEKDRNKDSQKYLLVLVKSKIFPVMENVRMNKLNSLKTQKCFKRIVDRCETISTGRVAIDFVLKILKFAFENGYLEEDFTKNLVLPVVKANVKPPFKSDDVENLFSNINNFIFKNALIILLMTGIDINELVALTFNDIDNYSSRIVISKYYSKIDDIILKFPDNLQFKNRIISVEDSVINAITSEFSKQANENRLGSNKNKYIFVDKANDFLRPKVFYKEFIKFVRKYSIKNIDSNDIKSIATEIMLESGLSELAIQFYMGYKSSNQVNKEVKKLNLRYIRSADKINSYFSNLFVESVGNDEQL